ncbi:MAG: bifunctional UDP-N-acetylglucosamine diphosphorylase/glucosamine-1-phosphate N-acetyltransferase GlmU [Actinomycetota bacterium]|nr:bifunctional UDP-N-acetylglucosamine diphosphorylase/glucosamine-1-phosphate N-acetyltransferase GlmU [Actinomycetota bacterium]
MRSATPKVLHQVAGRSLLGHVLEAAAALDPEHVVVVVGHGRDEVVAHVEEIAPWALTVVQETQAGTGHAVRIAMADLEERGINLGDAPVVVLTGDTPLLTGTTLQMLMLTHRETAARATVLTARLSDPAGYGRVIRDHEQSVQRIVEHKDASDAELLVDEVNSGMYCFAPSDLARLLSDVTTDNSQGEEYLTDVIGMLRSENAVVAAWLCQSPDEILGVNDRFQLAQAAAVMRDRINEQWMRAGVAILDSATTWLDVDVELEPDVTLLPNTTLTGPTSVARGARIGPGTTLASCEVGENSTVIHTWAQLAVIGADAAVGPFTYLRPGTVMGNHTKAGAFVEIKNSNLADDAKVPHLSYVGDGDIGEGTNIGAATVFCNFDGLEKHRTVVGKHVRIGSDTMLVAPVTIGDGAYTAAGSVITEDVPPGSMGIARGQQRNIVDWVLRRRPGSPAAKAAEAAQKNQEEG